MKVINIRALRMLSPPARLNIRPLADSLKEMCESVKPTGKPSNDNAVWTGGLCREGCSSSSYEMCTTAETCGKLKVGFEELDREKSYVCDLLSSYS